MSTYVLQTGRVDSRSNSSNDLSRQIETQNRPSEDDRYPGSFFRIPGVPAPGKTTWSLAK